MAVAGANGHMSRVFNNAARLRISTLTANAEPANDAFIKAQVALVWPYSSSKKEIAYLLTEKDELPSRSKGQIKAVFFNDLAKEVARSGVGIGDTICLGLADTVFASVQDVIVTPGKRVDLDLHLRKRLRLEATTISGASVLIDATSVTSPSHSNLNGIASTPHHQTINSHKTASDSIPFTSSPAYNAISRTSLGSLGGSPLDPSAADDGYVPGRGRKRTKYGRFSGSWKLVSSDDEDMNHPVRPSSTAARDPGMPPEDSLTTSNALHFHTDSQTTHDPGKVAEPTEVLVRNVDSTRNVTDEVIIQGQHPPVVQASIPAPPNETSGSIHRANIAPTPRLTPLLSPGLPLVSPLAQPNTYFYPIDSVSDLDATAHETANDLEASNEVQLRSSQHRQVGSFPPQNEALLIAAPPILPIEELRPDQETPSKPQTSTTEGVDLDFLQEQIDLAGSALLEPTPATAPVHDEILYGLPLQRHAVGTPDVPVEISSEEDEDDDVDDEAEDDNEAVLRDDVNADDDELVEVIGYSTDQPPVGEGSVSNEQQNLTAPVTGIGGFETYPRLPRDDLTLSNEYFAIDADTATSRLESHAPDGGIVGSLFGVMSENITPSNITTATNNVDIGPSNVGENVTSAVLLPSPKPLHLLDGVSDDRPSEAALANVSSGFESMPASSVTHPLSGPQLAYDQHDRVPTSVDMSALPLNYEQLITPDATQVPTTKSPLDAIDFQNLPMTPQESQTPKAQTREPSSPLEQEHRNARSPQALPASALRSSQRLLSKPPGSQTLFNDYFSPHSLEKVQASQIPNRDSNSRLHRRRLRSSSPADVQSAPIPDDVFAESMGSKARSQLRNKGTTTTLSYYPSLSTLANYFNQLVDVMGVATSNSTSIQKAKSGPKDYYTTIHLADMSLHDVQNIPIAAQLLRPRRTALPVIQKHDLIILRDFKVQTKAHNPILISTESSAWAVLRKPPSGIQPTVSTFEIIAAGPPVEIADKEIEHAEKLLEWWHDEDQSRYSELRLENTAHSQHDVKTVNRDSSPQLVPSSSPTAVTDSSPRKALDYTGNARDEVAVGEITNDELVEDQKLHGQPNQTSSSDIQYRSDEQLQQSSVAFGQDDLTGTLGGSDAHQQASTTPAQSRSLRKPLPKPIRTSIEIDLPPPPRRHTRSQSALAASQNYSPSVISPISPASVFTTQSDRSQMSPGSPVSLRRSSRTMRGGSISSAVLVASPRTTRRSARRSGTQESIIHELRDGTKYTDEPVAQAAEPDIAAASGGQEPVKPDSPAETSSRAFRLQTRANPDLKDQTVVHELRDGTRYIDGDEHRDQLDAQGGEIQHNRGADVKFAVPRSPTTKRSSKDENLVHELRDGTAYVDEDTIVVGTRTDRKGPEEQSSMPVQTRRVLRNQNVVHELRDGARYVD